MEAVETIELPGLKGAFVESLIRNNKKIREDRAQMIAKNARLMYKRSIEDMEAAMDVLQNERMNALDLSPSDAQSLVLASDFDARTFVDRDIKLGTDIRNLEIKMDIARRQFSILFGA